MITRYLTSLLAKNNSIKMLLRREGRYYLSDEGLEEGREQAPPAALVQVPGSELPTK